MRGPRESVVARRRRQAPEAGFSLPISRTLARRVLYSGLFFYASFLLHTGACSERGSASLEALVPEGLAAGIAAVATAAPPTEKGLLEPLLAALVSPGGRRP